MSYKYKSKDGLAQSNNKDLISSWDNIQTKHQSEETGWIAELRSKGIKAAHPDDGWVNRDNNSIQFVYPQFNDKPKAGDRIVLGWPWEYREVCIISIKQEGILNPHNQYYFKSTR